MPRKRKRVARLKQPPKRRCLGLLYNDDPCPNEARDGRYCGSCRCRAWTVAHPVEAYYKNLKNRARQRKKVFTLTLEEWRKFEAETDFMRQRAESDDVLSIDRIKENGGYTYDNICVKPLIYNWQKWHAWRTGRDTPKEVANEEKDIYPF